MLGRFGLAFAVLVLTACATAPVAERHPEDPWEGMNRATFAFNEGLDRYFMKPVAQGYDAAVPTVMQTGVRNFFGNLSDVWTAVNNLLQGKARAAGEDACRVLINSTVGVFGLIDVATPMGLDKHSEDFGQTLGVWGVGPGPYLVVPVFGPKTVRDAGGMVADMAFDPEGDVDPVRLRNSLKAISLVDRRASLLPAEKVFEQAALDKYVYLRSAYLQRRQYQVYDGRPPREDFFEE